MAYCNLRTYQIFLMLAIALLISAGCTGSQPAPAPVCNSPYILVGNGCCLDENSNAVCDSDEVQNPVAMLDEADAAQSQPSPADKILSEKELQLLATNTVQKFARLWEVGDWNAMYDFLPSEERKVLSRQEFAFFMEITNYDAKAKYDQDFQDALFNGFYETDPSKGLKVEIGDVVLLTETQAIMPTSSISYHGVPMWDWQGFMLVWEGGWKVDTIGVFFKGSDVSTVCPGTEYEYRCFTEYAKRFNDISSCENAGYYVSECYAYFDKPVPGEVALDACETYDIGARRDECLLNIAYEEGTDVCSQMSLPQDVYICYGVLAGKSGGLSECLDRIDESDYRVKANNEAQCTYGYVWVTGDRAACKKIDEDVAQDLRGRCMNKDFPYAG